MQKSLPLVLALVGVLSVFWGCGDDGSSSSVVSGDESGVTELESSSSVASSSSEARSSGVESGTELGSSGVESGSEPKSSGAESDTDSVSSSSEAVFEPESSSDAGESSSSSEAVSKKVWAYLNPEISNGEIVDSRDNQVYKTVTIGDQTWMAENLNYRCGQRWSCGSDWTG